MTTPDRLALLERIAEVARYVRGLERSLEIARDPGRVRASLVQAKHDLDELLRDLSKLER